jgi:hypothetical protein
LGTVGAMLLTAAASPAFSPQDDVRTCLVCHDDAELQSSAGKTVYVNFKTFASSVHGRTGLGCVGCHADLKDFDDFPHPSDLKPVTCAGCHAGYGRTSLGGVHATASPRLGAKPVSCKDCHGHHDVLPSSDPGSFVHPSRRPATCAGCHSGAGPNFSKGRVHETAVASGHSPAGVIRILYKALIGAMTGFFLLYVGVDILHWMRTRWTK